MLVESEGDLLKHARRLDEDALATIFDTYYTPIYRYILFYLKCDATAEELTSEVFRRLLECLHRRQGPKKNLKAWLYRVARNLALDKLRSWSRHQTQVLPDTLIDPDASTDGQARQSILVKEMYEALNLLTQKQYDVIMLRYFAGLSNAETAQALRLPVSAVKALRHRAITTLQQALSEDNLSFTLGESA